MSNMNHKLIAVFGLIVVGVVAYIGYGFFNSIRLLLEAAAK